MRSKLYDAMYGFVLGGVVGVPYEFNARGRFKATEPIGNGTYDQPKGTWSDDTSLTLCLMENISEGGSYVDLMSKFSKYRDGYMTPFGKMFDIGLGTTAAINYFDYHDKEPVECGWRSEDSNGNGSLMRVLPLVFTLKDKDFDEVFSEVKNISSLTHGHQRSILGCLIYVLVMMELNKGNGLTESIQKVKVELDRHLDDKYLRELRNYKKMFETGFKETEEDKIQSSGYVVDTLLASIWSVLNTETTKEAILKSVNLGRDTDTVGAVTGSISGMMYGLDKESEEWLEVIQNKELLDAKLKEFQLHLENK